MMLNDKKTTEEAITLLTYIAIKKFQTHDDGNMIELLKRFP